MNEPFFSIFATLLGGVLGFFLKWFLAERKERYELRRSIAPMRAEAYKSLWPLCRELKLEERSDRTKELSDWYHSGNGLFLSLAASQRFFSAMKLMQQKTLTEPELKTMETHLSWLRTEMKYHVGSYTRREKETQIHDVS